MRIARTTQVCGTGLLAMAACLLAGLPLRAQDWSSRGEGEAVEAGSLIDGAFAGVVLRCESGGRVDLVLTHNGTVFDRERAHTIVLSVDGTATVLPARAVPGERAGDDDLVHGGDFAALEPLLAALSGGTTLEVSAPSGRYILGLAGSSRAIADLREGCRPR